MKKTGRTIWIEKKEIHLLGVCYEISCVAHDGILYKAGSVKEAVKKYEADKNVSVKEYKIIK